MGRVEGTKIVTDWFWLREVNAEEKPEIFFFPSSLEECGDGEG